MHIGKFTIIGLTRLDKKGSIPTEVGIQKNMRCYAVYILARNTMEHSTWALRVTLDSGFRRNGLSLKYFNRVSPNSFKIITVIIQRLKGIL